MMIPPRPTVQSDRRHEPPDGALRAALQLAARGMPVVPVPAGRADPAPGWRKRATTDPAAVRAAFAAEPGAGVAVALTLAAGIVAVERPDDGAADLIAEVCGGRLPSTPTFYAPPRHSGELGVYVSFYRVSAEAIGGVKWPEEPRLRVGRDADGQPYLLGPDDPGFGEPGSAILTGRGGGTFVRVPPFRPEDVPPFPPRPGAAAARPPR